MSGLLANTLIVVTDSPNGESFPTTYDDTFYWSSPKVHAVANLQNLTGEGSQTFVFHSLQYSDLDGDRASMWAKYFEEELSQICVKGDPKVYFDTGYSFASYGCHTGVTNLDQAMGNRTQGAKARDLDTPAVRFFSRNLWPLFSNDLSHSDTLRKGTLSILARTEGLAIPARQTSNTTSDRVHKWFQKAGTGSGRYGQIVVIDRWQGTEPIIKEVINLSGA